MHMLVVIINNNLLRQHDSIGLSKRKKQIDGIWYYTFFFPQEISGLLSISIITVQHGSARTKMRISV